MIIKCLSTPQKTPQKHEKSCFSLLFLFSLRHFCFALLKWLVFLNKEMGLWGFRLSSTPTFVFSLVSIMFRGLTFPWNPNLNMNWRNPKPWGWGERETHTHKALYWFRSIKYNNRMRWFSNMNWKILVCDIQFWIDTLSIKKDSLSSWPPHWPHRLFGHITMLVEGAILSISMATFGVPVVGPYVLPSTWFPPLLVPFLPSIYIPPWRLWHNICRII